jgi:hypothetical protein
MANGQVKRIIVMKPSKLRASRIHQATSVDSPV